MTHEAPKDTVAPALDGLTTSSEPSDPAKDGFHVRHVATADRVVELARRFDEAGYFLEMITAEDRRGDLEAMRLVYTYNRYGEADRHLVLVDLSSEIPGASAPSCVPVFPAADWFEREVFDMYGITFDGHPDLKRILLPDDADFHALLKDFGRIEDAPPEEDPPERELTV